MEGGFKFPVVLDFSFHSLFYTLLSLSAWKFCSSKYHVCRFLDLLWLKKSIFLWVIFIFLRPGFASKVLWCFSRLSLSFLWRSCSFKFLKFVSFARCFLFFPDSDCSKPPLFSSSSSLSCLFVPEKSLKIPTTLNHFLLEGTLKGDFMLFLWLVFFLPMHLYSLTFHGKSWERRSSLLTAASIIISFRSRNTFNFLLKADHHRHHHL